MEKITADNPLSKSADLIKQNLEVLKSLFPTIVKEGKIDITELQALLGEEIETNEEYYRFTWAGKSLARQEANKPSTGTLRPVPSESSKRNGEKYKAGETFANHTNQENQKNKSSDNIFIEGDNLEVLKLMQKSYSNKIKMIYIDPPYNTGKDFVYKDNYADNLGNYLSISGQTDEEGKKLSTNTESDGRYHSNWLNMMYPRLKLARNLLKEDGVIFISIDYNEIHNLRKVTDEVFGENNFLSELVWNLKSGTQAGHFTRSNEFVVVYVKNKEKLSFFGDNSGGVIKHGALKKISKVNPSSEIEFPIGFEIEDNPNAIFKGELGGSEKQFIISNEMKFKDGKLIRPVTIKAGWGMRDQIESWLNGEDVVDSKGQKVTRFFFNAQGILWYEKERGTFHPKTVLPDDEIGTTKNGSKEIIDLFGIKVFDFPKPWSLLRFLIELVTANERDAIILDFFAGSGTTAHATMHLNSEDGENRKFICVQLPEPTAPESEAYKSGYKNIAEITKERIRRAGKKIKSEIKEDLLTKEGKSLDIGFRVFKLDSSNINAWDGDIKNFKQNLLSASENIKQDRTEEDVLYEILLKSGLDLAQPIEEKTIAGKKVFNIGLGALFICLANKITTAVAEGIGKWKQELEPATCRVIFKDTGFTDVEKTNSIQILKRHGILEVNTI